MTITFAMGRTPVKYINNQSGKSDAHQKDQLLRTATHKQEQLEKWFTKISTPKPVKAKRVVKPKVKIARAPADPMKAVARYKKYTAQVEDATDPETKKKWEAYVFLVVRDHPYVLTHV